MKKIQLTQGYNAIVDNADYEYLNQYNWHAYRNGNMFYAKGWVNGRRTLMHRLILGIVDKSKICVDHINRNGLDNRKCNLRVASKAQNMWNSHKKSYWRGYPVSSRYKGVTWHKDTKRWLAQAVYNSRHHHLGLYDTEEEAALAYNIFAKEYYGEFARLNNVKEPPEPEPSVEERLTEAVKIMEKMSLRLYRKDEDYFYSPKLEGKTLYSQVYKFLAREDKIREVGNEVQG